MANLDEWITQLGNGPETVLLVAILLGLRHATDPDHIAAVSSLVLGDRTDGVRQARILGTAWGLGHGTTLFFFGLPIVFFRRHLPDAIHQVAEVAVGAIIVLLAARLLIRWKQGHFHAHPHQHDGVLHAHPHLHEHRGSEPHAEVHRHRHAEAIGRSPLAAFGIGLVHGVGGSAAAGILIVGAAPSAAAGVLALFLFALGTAASMTLLTWVFGVLLVRRPPTRRIAWVIPALGLASLGFGVWYGLHALAA
jgi:ABC-type nickel/cobalt efflux system permease component RcnA